MFKGTLIENEEYYNLRSKQILLFMIPTISIALLANFLHMPIWIIIGAILLFVGIMFLMTKNQKKIVKIANKQIEIDSKQILLKESNGNVIESIKLHVGTQIKLKDDYKMSQETIADLKEEITGNAEKHFVIVKQENSERRFDFEISSYYMQNQLKKVIQDWGNEDYLIEYVQ